MRLLPPLSIKIKKVDIDGICIVVINNVWKSWGLLFTSYGAFLVQSLNYRPTFWIYQIWSMSYVWYTEQYRSSCIVVLSVKFLKMVCDDDLNPVTVFPCLYYACLHFCICSWFRTVWSAAQLGLASVGQKLLCTQSCTDKAGYPSHCGWMCVYALRRYRGRMQIA